MKNFLSDAVAKPFLAILFFIVFGGAFVFFGFQNIKLEIKRDASGVMSADFTRRHFWGIYKVERHVDDLKGIAIDTKKHRRRSSGRHHRHGTSTVSKVVLYSDTERVPLMPGSSNVDGKTKREIVDRVNAFINDPEQTVFNETFAIRNLFGWIGLPFFIIGVLGLVGWPFKMLKYKKSAE